MTSRREFIETAVKGVAGLTLVGMFAPNIAKADGCTQPNCPDCGACDGYCDVPPCDNGCDSSGCDASECDASGDCDVTCDPGGDCDGACDGYCDPVGCDNGCDGYCDLQCDNAANCDTAGCDAAECDVTGACDVACDPSGGCTETGCDTAGCDSSECDATGACDVACDPSGGCTETGCDTAGCDSSECDATGACDVNCDPAGGCDETGCDTTGCDSSECDAFGMCDVNCDPADGCDVTGCDGVCDGDPCDGVECDGVECDGVECDGVECDGVECDGVVCDGVECDGVECDGVECDGVECDGVECDGVECDGVECDGVECDGVECDGVECDGVAYDGGDPPTTGSATISFPSLPEGWSIDWGTAFDEPRATGGKDSWIHKVEFAINVIYDGPEQNPDPIPIVLTLNAPYVNVPAKMLLGATGSYAFVTSGETKTFQVYPGVQIFTIITSDKVGKITIHQSSVSQRWDTTPDDSWEFEPFFIEDEESDVTFIADVCGTPIDQHRIVMRGTSIELSEYNTETGEWELIEGELSREDIENLGFSMEDFTTFTPSVTNGGAVTDSNGRATFQQTIYSCPGGNVNLRTEVITFNAYDKDSYKED